MSPCWFVCCCFSEEFFIIVSQIFIDWVSESKYRSEFNRSHCDLNQDLISWIGGVSQAFFPRLYLLFAMIAKKISGETVVYGESESITHILRLDRRAVLKYQDFTGVS